MLDSWRLGTKRQYQCYIDKWLQYCELNDLDAYDPSIDEVLQFLLHSFQRGLSYSTLNTVRSALSSMLTCEGKPVGQNELVVKFMKAVYLKRPALKRRGIIWDYNEILDFMKQYHPAEKLDIATLTKKLVTLMAILAGVRGQVLYFLHTDYMILEPDYVIFHIPELTKTSRPGSPMFELRFEAYPRDKRVCVVHYLRVYLERTLKVRWIDRHVFLTYGKSSKY